VENETRIQAALSRRIGDKTVLVIAHRMRTVSGADKVAVLSNGRVAEQGTPEKLMNTGEIYPHMVKPQGIGGEWGI
jgi:ATP-binding cassette subfamily B protein IrtB